MCACVTPYWKLHKPLAYLNVTYYMYIPIHGGMGNECVGFQIWFVYARMDGLVVFYSNVKTKMQTDNINLQVNIIPSTDTYIW